MANIRIDADGLQNNISSMRAYINELDSLTIWKNSREI